MTKAPLAVAVFSILVVSCGGGSSSGASSDKAVPDVNHCIDYHIEGQSPGSLGPGSTDYVHTITNTCDFDVNFGYRNFGLVARTIPSGRSLILDGILQSENPEIFIACQPPSVPLDEQEFDFSIFRDQVRAKPKELYCFGG